MVHPSDPYIVCIDGSFGEGGGQILRTSLALSCLLGKPVEIRNIRKSRRNPGLRPQHLTAVMAAASIANAVVQGANLSSTSLQFQPDGIRGGTYHFDVAKKKASAGSVSLLLQTILLPLCFAGRTSLVTVKGGTPVPWSPSFHYLTSIVNPLLFRLGVIAEYAITSWGWYPVGNGHVSARITPVRALQPFTLIDRGNLLSVTGISAISNLPDHIATRQRDRALAVLSRQGIEASIETLSVPSTGKGSFLFLTAEFENLSVGFDSLGAAGKRAEEVADEACTGLLSYLHAKGALDPHLADQIVPWLAFCHGSSEFTTSRVTRHLLTNIWVIQQFMDVEVRVEGNEGEAGRILIRPPACANHAISRGD